MSFSGFKDRLSSDFTEWFPPPAWGSSRFIISYSCGGYHFNIKRSSGRGGVKDTVSVELPPELESLYNSYLSEANKQKRAFSSRSGTSFPNPSLLYSLQRNVTRQVSELYGVNYTASQTYVPAGRAFFTTVGRAVAAFEQSRMFDPITSAFGRLYVGLRERGRFGYSGSSARRKKMESIFGGTLRVVKNELFVHTEDGRTIPTSALSSGQQELLPLWFTLDYFDGPVSWSDGTSGTNLLYIEEPEAHLFPEAQASLVEMLAEIVNRTRLSP